MEKGHVLPTSALINGYRNIEKAFRRGDFTSMNLAKPHLKTSRRGSSGQTGEAKAAVHLPVELVAQLRGRGPKGAQGPLPFA